MSRSRRERASTGRERLAGTGKTGRPPLLAPLHERRLVAVRLHPRAEAIALEQSQRLGMSLTGWLTALVHQIMDVDPKGPE